MSCCLKSEDNVTDILLMQLKREIYELEKSTTSRLLIQDGKIAETCVYIKNNLSNYIRTMLDNMETSGEIDKIITETITSDIEILQARTNYIVNVNEYGITGDGSGITQIKFSALMNVKTPSGTGAIHSISIKRTRGASTISVADGRIRPTGTYETCSIPTKILNVQEGDLISFYIQSSTIGEVISNASYLTVEAI